MLSLPERLEGITRVLERSNHELESRDDAAQTGFLPVLPEFLAQSTLGLIEALGAHSAPTRTVLDLGCGNGGWMLMAAAAGFPSYGIEINPLLVEHARRNYDECVMAGFIDPAVPCVFVVGDMIPPHWRARYAQYARQHPECGHSMPLDGSAADGYALLGVSIGSADIIYTWAWPTQSRFVFNMLEHEAKQDAIFVLPCYLRYTQGEHMNAYFKERNELQLSPLADPVRDVFIGRRAK